MLGCRPRHYDSRAASGAEGEIALASEVESDNFSQASARTGLFVPLFCAIEMTLELQQVVPVGLLLLVAIAFALGMLLTPVIIGKKRVHNPVKDSP